MATPYNNALENQAKKILANGILIQRSRFKNLEISVCKFERKYVEIWFRTDTCKYYKIDPVGDNMVNPFLKHLHLSTLN